MGELAGFLIFWGFVEFTQTKTSKSDKVILV